MRWAGGNTRGPKATSLIASGETGPIDMVLLDAALPYRCRYAQRRLARRGSSRSWSPHGADRAALSPAILKNQLTDRAADLMDCRPQPIEQPPAGVGQ
jgi:hypothetical protein